MSVFEPPELETKKVHFRKLGNSIQILLFSATYSDSMATFAKDFVPPPFTSITLQREKLSLDKIRQLFIDCKTQENKLQVLDEIFGFLSVGQAIIFVQVSLCALFSLLYLLIQNIGNCNSAVSRPENAGKRAQSGNYIRRGHEKPAT